MFHIEISAGVHRARVFNLDRDDLAEKIVRPWLEDRTISAGDRSWQPRQSTLRVLEGPRMENADLAYGQGWANAERRCEDATGEMLEQAAGTQPTEAFVIETDNPEAITALLAGAEARKLPIEDAEARLDGRDPGVAAVVLVVRRPGGPKSR